MPPDMPNRALIHWWPSLNNSTQSLIHCIQLIYSKKNKLLILLIHTTFTLIYDIFYSKYNIVINGILYITLSLLLASGRRSEMVVERRQEGWGHVTNAATRLVTAKILPSHLRDGRIFAVTNRVAALVTWPHPSCLRSTTTTSGARHRGQ